MKKGLLFTLLLALFGLVRGSLTVKAQTPEPTAKWTFDNAEDLMAPSVGNLTMTPCLIPESNQNTKFVTPTDIATAGIVRADDEEKGITAIYVPRTSALKVPRAEDAEESTTYTILMDIMVPSAQTWVGLLQMDENNQNDGDLFINNYKVGIASLGAYAGNIEDGKWYRIVFTYNTDYESGQGRLYLDGKKIREGGENARHIMQPFGFYLFCDEDGEVNDAYVSQVAYWETPLTDEEVAELGNAMPAHEHNFVDFFCTTCGAFQDDYLTPNTDGFYEIGSAKDLSWFELKVNLGELTANAILTADIDFADLMPEDANPDGTEIDWTPIGDWGQFRGTSNAGYQGHFDGQGHTIKNLNHRNYICRRRGSILPRHQPNNPQRPQLCEHQQHKRWRQTGRHPWCSNGRQCKL